MSAPSPNLSCSGLTSSSSRDAKGQRVRIPELDGFRGLAILLVITGHTLTFTLKIATGVGEQLGHLGVLLFFILSGFLITGLLRAEFEQTETIRLKRFYLRRVFRLLPPLFVFLIGVEALRLIHLINDVPITDILAVLAYVRNVVGRSQSLGHLWSLSLEEQFYTVWPLLFVLLGERRMRQTALWITVGVMLWRGVAITFDLWSYTTGVFYLRPWFRFDSIAIGCWLAFLTLPKFTVRLWWFLAGTLLIWALWGEESSRALFLTIETVLAAAFFAAIIGGGLFVRGFFSARWMQWLGKISYSLYLWQQIFTVSTFKVGWLRLFPFNILAALLLAILSHQFVELPFLNWGRKCIGTGPTSKFPDAPVLFRPETIA